MASVEYLDGVRGCVTGPGPRTACQVVRRWLLSKRLGVVCGVRSVLVLDDVVDNDLEEERKFLAFVPLLT